MSSVTHEITCTPASESEEPEKWSFNEKQRLKQLYLAVEDLPKTNDRIIEDISYKLRRTRPEIINELKILGIYDESRGGGKELKDNKQRKLADEGRRILAQWDKQIDTPPITTIRVKQPPELRKQPVGENQDVGYLLTKLLNDGSALTNTKLDELTAAVKENSSIFSAASRDNSKFQREEIAVIKEVLKEELAILKEELVIIKEQYAVWKEKHTTP